MRKIFFIYLAVCASLAFGDNKQITLGYYLESLNVLGDGKSAFVLGSPLNSRDVMDAYQVDLISGQVIQNISLSPVIARMIYHLKMNSQGTYAILSGLSDDRHNYVYLWNANTKAISPLLVDEVYDDTQFDFSKDGRFLFSLYYENDVTRFTSTELATGIVKTIYELPNDTEKYKYYIPRFTLDDSSNKITFSVNQLKQNKLISATVFAFEPDLGIQMSETVKNLAGDKPYYELLYVVSPDNKYLFYLGMDNQNMQYFLREVATGNETILPRPVLLEAKSLPPFEQHEFQFVDHYLIMETRYSEQPLQVYDIKAGTLKDLGFSGRHYFLLGQDQIGICSEKTETSGPCPTMMIFSLSTFDLQRKIDLSSLSAGRNIYVYARSIQNDLIVVRTNSDELKNQGAEVFKVPVSGSAPSKVGDISGLSEYWHSFPQCQFTTDLTAATCVDIINEQHVLNRITF